MHSGSANGVGAAATLDHGAALTVSAALDALAHVLDIGPPSTGLGSSWHRRRS
jgi:hypothetical protein